MDRKEFPARWTWLVLIFQQISNLRAWLTDICSNVYTHRFSESYNINLCTQTRNPKNTSSPFCWVYVLFLFWLPVPLLHSSLFSEEIKMSEYLSIINCKCCISLGWKLQDFQVLSHVFSYFWVILHVLPAFWILCALISFPYPHFPRLCRHLKSPLWVRNTAKRRCLPFPFCVTANKTYPERAT